MERKILHVDVNNAFLSWTALYMLKNGSKIDIRNVPAVIAGDEDRRAGVVLAKSMVAKSFGVVSGETLYQARCKCPALEVFSPNFEFYRECSNKLYNMLLEYTDHIERFSIDECFLDMTSFLINTTIEEVASKINRRAREELGFTVNIGIAPNKLLAKMASDFAKPDRIHTLYKNEIPSKMWCLPVNELFMLGKKTAPKLYNMNIQTIGDLAHTDEKLLIRKFGKQGKMMWEFANGIDDSEVIYMPEKPKGIGNSTTLPRDVHTLEEIYDIVSILTERVAYRLRAEDMIGTTVSVQLRTSSFQNASHQGKLECATANTKIICEKAKELARELYKKGDSIRLVGVRVDGLIDKNEKQFSLFETEKNEKEEKLEQAIDMIKNKYGYNKISSGTNMKYNK